MVNGGGSGFAGQPDGIAVSHPCVHDWPDADGARGGTPLPHLAGSGGTWCPTAVARC